MAWHLAPALNQLRAEVNKKWPNRSKISDGTIGDPAHSARVSDHNPNGRGSVNAMDITAAGIDTGTLIAVMKKHPSTRYIIHNRRIMNRDIGNWAPRVYTGANPHTQHVHISLYQTATAERRTQSWGLANAKPVSGVGGGGGGGSTYESASAKHEVGSRVMKLHSGGSDVYWLQRRLYRIGYKITPKKNGDFDKLYGTETRDAVKALQEAAKITVDGLAGKDTIAAAKAAKVKRELPTVKKPAKPKKSAYPLPKGHFYYTEDRRSTVHSGYWSKDRPAIRKIQKKVGTGVDGGYGVHTKAKVKAWQKKHGLKADGAVGPSTWRKMF